MAPTSPLVASSHSAHEHKEGPLEGLCDEFPESNRSPGTELYAFCHALLIVFESDDLGGCLTEAESLGEELENWQFDVEIYRIPFITQDKLQEEVERAVASFILKYDKGSNLLLVHYGGHGYVNRAGQFIIAMPNEGLWHHVRLAPIRQQFMECKADVAIIIDACEAYAGCYRHYPDPNTVEVLAACAENTDTPEVGPKSFTSAIIRALRNCKQDTLTIRELRERLRNAPSLENEPIRVALKQSGWGSITLRRARGYKAGSFPKDLFTGHRALQKISGLREMFVGNKQIVRWGGRIVVEETDDAGFLVVSWVRNKI